MPELREEMLIGLEAILTGGVLLTIYRCMVCVRQLIKHTWIWVNVEDVAYWIFSAVYVSVQIYQTSDGSVRLFFILGVVVGASFFAFFFQMVRHIAQKFLRFFKDKK